MLRCGECGSLVQPCWTKNHGREYRYYTCSKRIKTGYANCTLPSLPAGEIESVVVDQLRETLRHPDVIAHTFREVAACGVIGQSSEQTSRLDEFSIRRKQTESGIRSLLTLDGQGGEFIKTELERLNGELNTLNKAIVEIENANPGLPTTPIELDEVSNALQRLDPIWELLIPEEQRRVLELLVERVIVAKDRVNVHFRANGIEQIVNELSPIGTTTKKKKAK